MLARYAPGLGDPMDMTVPELQDWQKAVGGLLEREFGKPSQRDVDHRAIVEEQMRRIHG